MCGSLQLLRGKVACKLSVRLAFRYWFYTVNKFKQSSWQVEGESNDCFLVLLNTFAASAFSSLICPFGSISDDNSE